MPWDADDDDDPTRPPPPPDDRLWRHPSELGSAAAGQRIVIAPRPSAGRLWLVGVLACVLGSSATVAVMVALGAFDDEDPSTAVERVMADAGSDSDTATIDLAAPVLPAIVRIDARSPASARSGTGVIIRTDGYLLATSDCVDGATELQVTLSDGTSLPATLVGRDRDSDVAVLKVDRTDLPVATLLDPPDNQTANQLLAFGDPTVIIDAAPSSGPTPSLTDGFVSDTSRRLDSDSGAPLFGVIQVSTSPRTAAAGNGRVLIDANGAVLGIVSSRGEAAEGPAATDESGLSLQFATPVDHAYTVFEQLVQTGHVATPMLGINGIDVSGDDAERLGASAGVQIETIDGGSPAADAGLRPGDLVVGVDGQPVTDLNDVVVSLRRHRPGDTIVITYLRRGERDVTNAVLTEKPGLP